MHPNGDGSVTVHWRWLSIGAALLSTILAGGTYLVTRLAIQPVLPQEHQQVLDALQSDERRLGTLEAMASADHDSRIRAEGDMANMRAQLDVFTSQHLEMEGQLREIRDLLVRHAAK